jgi:hypothetical protein
VLCKRQLYRLDDFNRKYYIQLSLLIADVELTSKTISRIVINHRSNCGDKTTSKETDVQMIDEVQLQPSYSRRISACPTLFEFWVTVVG